MFCTNCGSEMEEGAKFCVKCGMPVAQDDVSGADLDEFAENVRAVAKSAKNMAQNAAENIANNVKTYAESEKVQKVKNDKKLLKNIATASIGIVIVLGGVFAFSKLHKHSLNIEDYTTIEYQGCNKYGTASVSCDTLQMTTDIVRYGKFNNEDLKQVQNELKKAHKKNEAAKEYIDEKIEYFDDNFRWGTEGTEYEEVEDLARDVAEAIQYEIEKADNLSNGDEVVVNYTYDKELFKKYGINLKGNKAESKVKNLSDAKEVDPFEKISVEFEGVSPHAKVNVINNNDELSSYFSVHVDGDKNEFKVGDTVTVVVEAREDNLMKDKGLHFSSLSKDFTCEGVDAYVDSASQISENIMESMRAQAEDTLRSSMASRFADEVSVKNVESIGNYFLAAKDGMDTDYNNQIYMIFKITVKKKGEKQFSYYYYTRYHDIIVLSDGTCSVDTSSYDVPSPGGWFEEGESFEKQELEYAGYLDINSLFNNCVTSQTEKNEYENNVTDSAAESSDADDTSEDIDEASDDITDGDYIISDSDSRELSEKDIESLTLKELNYAKNEIYARHGRIFESRELNDYFQSKSWYKGTVNPEDFSEDVLTEAEKKNVILLKEKELAIDPAGYPLDAD